MNESNLLTPGEGTRIIKCLIFRAINMKLLHENEIHLPTTQRLVSNAISITLPHFTSHRELVSTTVSSKTSQILYNEIHQHLKNLHNLLNYYLPDNQCMMLQNHAWVKDPFKVTGQHILMLTK